MRARIGPYRIVGTLGHGGMGIVYEGFHDGLQRRAAIKTLNSIQGTATDPDVWRRLRAEAQAQARLQHPNIVLVYDLIEDGGEAFIAMEHVEGTTLDVVLSEQQGSGLPLSETLRIGGQLLAALEYAHQQGVIHRDVKPANVILGEERVKLADFGIALLAGIPRQTAAAVILGTPTYMSPEQFQGPEVDCRTDVYSAAVVLYEMLAGRPPFTGGSHLELMSHHLRDEPADLRTVAPALPAGVCEVIVLALRKEPRERYQTAGELLSALQEGAAGFLPTAPVVPQAPRATTAAQRVDPTVLLPSPPVPALSPKVAPPSPHRRWLAAAALFFGLSGLGSWGLWRHLHMPAPPASDPVVARPAHQIIPSPAEPTEHSDVSAETVSLSSGVPSRPPKDPRAASVPLVAPLPVPPTPDPMEEARRELDRIREELRQGIAAVEADLLAESFTVAEDRLDRLSGLVQSHPAELQPEGEEVRRLRRQLTDARVAEQTRGREEELQRAAWERRLQTIQDLLAQGKFPEADSMAAALGKEVGVPQAVSTRAAELSAQAKDELKKVWGDTKIGPTQNRIQKPPKPGGGGMES